MDYAIRIRRSYASLKLFSEYLNEVVTKWVIYEHPEEGNVHIHGLLLGCNCSTDTLKNQVKKALGVTKFPKEEWSFITEYKDKNTKQMYKVSQENSDKFITYMSKGKYEPKGSKGYEIEYFEERRKAWITRTNETERPTPKKRSKKETHFDICMRIREKALKREALVRNPEGSVETRMVFTSFENVYRLLLKELDDNRIRTSEYDMDRWLFTILRDDPMGESVMSRLRQKYSSKFENNLLA